MLGTASRNRAMTVPMNQQLLAQLVQTLKRQMPISTAMQIAVANWDSPLCEGGRLTMSIPLAPNRNHQQTAFAGSLNALCTVVGWGTMFILLGERGLSGNIVIHRSTIRYRKPVQTAKIVAGALPLPRESVDYFFELLNCKGTSKLELSVEISGQDSAGQEGTLVTFKGAYVVNKR